MTDLTPELGASVTCPNCGYQIQASPTAGSPLRCPSCGAEVEGGWREHTQSDLTDHEVLRSFGVKGYLTDVAVVEPTSLSCGNCGQVEPADRWHVDDIWRASNMVTPGTPESAIAALRCPNCGEMGRVELPLQGTDTPDDRVFGALAAAWDQSL